VLERNILLHHAQCVQHRRSFYQTHEELFDGFLRQVGAGVQELYRRHLDVTQGCLITLHRDRVLEPARIGDLGGNTPMCDGRGKLKEPT